MRTRDVVGRRIVRVEQRRSTWNGGQPYVNCDALVLDNGRRIYFTVIELDGDYGVEARVTPRRPATGKEE